MSGGTAIGRSWADRLAAGHDALTRAGFVGAAVCLAAIVGAYCYEVVARYFLSAPTVWANALVSYALCAMVFLAMPELSRQKAHIVLNLLPDRLSPQRAASLQRVIRFVAVAACLFAAWFSADATISQYAQGIETMSAWPIPKWPLSMVIPYGMLSTSLYFLRQVSSNERDLPAGSAFQ